MKFGAVLSSGCREPVVFAIAVFRDLYCLSEAWITLSEVLQEKELTLKGPSFQKSKESNTVSVLTVKPGNTSLRLYQKKHIFWWGFLFYFFPSGLS